MAIKLKRGTTESWALGHELVDFELSSTKGKDSVIHAEGTELEMYVYTTSANEWWTNSPASGGQSTGKIPGLPIYVNGKRNPKDATGDGAVGCTLKIYFEAPSDCTLEYLDGIGDLRKPQFVNYEYIDTHYYQGASHFPELFIKWPAEKVGTAEPVPIKIRVSLRENWLCEELEEGQLGLEYTEDGQVKLKAGKPGISKWNELPYINNNQISVTHEELVELRDSSALTPGMLYRITDYECTTTQEGTMAAGHKFDIIVQALSSDTLSEIASADYHLEDGESDGYFATKRKSIPTVEWLYTILDDGNGIAPYDTVRDDIMVECAYAENNEGVIVPILYKNNEDEYPGEVDYQDVLYYVGTFALDREIYDRWRKIDQEFTWDSDQMLYILTNVVVDTNKNIFLPGVANGKTIGGPIADLPAWELKYCLDNDTTRFAWADADNGKGVIYYMKDEYGNECPYDFKNIMFKRNKAWWDRHIEFFNDLGLGAEFAISDITWLYTFTLVTESYVVEDLTTRPNFKMADNNSNTLAGAHHNSINVNDVGKLASLPDILFINTFAYNPIFCSNNTFSNNCFSNTFGNNCYNNAFGNTCHLNTFGNNCYENIFGNGCNYNTFGNNCFGDIFGSDCQHNRFGHDCEYNTFGNYCYDNIFGHNCSANVFGTKCHTHTFGDNCQGNTFGNYCNNNTFGNYCSYNAFDISCYNNVLNKNCSKNTFNTGCYKNTLGNGCDNNTFGRNCQHNTLGNSCWHNTFGSECYRNNCGQSFTHINIYTKNSYIDLTATTDTGIVQYVTIGPCVSGTQENRLQLTVERDAAPVVFEAAGTTHIILD